MNVQTASSAPPTPATPAAAAEATAPEQGFRQVLAQAGAGAGRADAAGRFEAAGRQRDADGADRPARAPDDADDDTSTAASTDSAATAASTAVPDLAQLLQSAAAVLGTPAATAPAAGTAGDAAALDTRPLTADADGARRGARNGLRPMADDLAPPATAAGAGAALAGAGSPSAAMAGAGPAGARAAARAATVSSADAARDARATARLDAATDAAAANAAHDAAGPAEPLLVKMAGEAVDGARPLHAAPARNDTAPAPLSALAGLTTPASSPAGAATTTVTVHTPVTQPGFGAELGNRVVLLAARNLQGAEITVTPADLGPVKVAIDMRGNEATLNFQAAHPATRAALEDALPRLRDMFQASGLQLANASVGGEPRRDPSQARRDGGAGPAVTAVGGVAGSQAGAAVGLEAGASTAAPRRALRLVDTFV